MENPIKCTECGGVDIYGPVSDYWGVCCVDCGHEMQECLAEKTRKELEQINIIEAISNVTKANEELYKANQSMRSSIVNLVSLSPYKVGDNIEHKRYGTSRIFAVSVRLHHEYGALWDLTIQPFINDGKPGARKVSCLLKTL